MAERSVNSSNTAAGENVGEVNRWASKYSVLTEPYQTQTCSESASKHRKLSPQASHIQNGSRTAVSRVTIVSETKSTGKV